MVTGSVSSGNMSVFDPIDSKECDIVVEQVMHSCWYCYQLKGGKLPVTTPLIYD